VARTLHALAGASVTTTYTAAGRHQQAVPTVGTLEKVCDVSALVGLGTALSGLRASQLGLDVASPNVAGVNTSGHTR